MEILVPTAAAHHVENAKIGCLPTLAGKRVGIVSNGWQSMEAMVPRLRERLTQYGISRVSLFSVHINKPITTETLDQVAESCDAAIVGLAN